MFQNIDFRLNVTPNSTNLTDLKAINAELEKMVDLMAKAGMGGGGVGGGIGGMGGGGPAASAAASAAGVSTSGGGGAGGTSGTTVRSSSAGGAGNAPANAAAAAGFSGFGSFGPSGGGGGGAAGPGAGAGFVQRSNETAALSGDPEQHKMTAEERHRQNLRRWQLTMGIQSLGYGLEDIYYSGVRGALNNFPFAAQGLAALAGVDPNKAMAVSGVTALVATAGMVTYDNRERIAKSMGIGLGTREDSILGIPELTGAQKSQKQISDAMYYVDKYGRGSGLGQRYLSEAVGAMEAEGKDIASRASEQEIARIRNLPDLALRTRAGLMNGLGGDTLAQSLFRQANTPTESQIRDQAELLFRDKMIEPISNLMGIKTPMPESFMTENRAKATENAINVLRTQNESFSAKLAAAYSGDSQSLKGLEDKLKDGSLSGRNREMAEEAVKLGRSMTPFAADRISSLRASAANPYANIDRIKQQIGGYLGDAADTLMPALEEDMRENQRMTPTTWQQRFTANQERYVANIAASYGGIQASGSRGNLRTGQLNALQGEIFNDLIRSGVPATQARTLARELNGKGLASFRQNWNDSNIPNGMNQMQNFMMGLGEEQQMMFGQFMQNGIQIQMHQQLLRQQRMRRTRFGLRGMN